MEWHELIKSFGPLIGLIGFWFMVRRELRADIGAMKADSDKKWEMLTNRLDATTRDFHASIRDFHNRFDSYNRELTDIRKDMR